MTSTLSWILAPVAMSGALLLLTAGVAKLHNPNSVVDAADRVGLGLSFSAIRFFAVIETGIGVAALSFSNRIVDASAAVLYLFFSSYLLYRLVHGINGGCGCGGAGDIPPSYLHVALNLCAGSAFIVGGVHPLPSILDAVRQTPWMGFPYMVGIAAIAYVAYRVVVLVPPLFNLVTKGVDVDWLKTVLRKEVGST
jgi:hypothetical protein